MSTLLNKRADFSRQHCLKSRKEERGDKTHMHTEKKKPLTKLNQFEEKKEKQRFQEKPLFFSSFPLL
jgi:hypothetical protein